MLYTEKNYNIVKKKVKKLKKKEYLVPETQQWPQNWKRSVFIPVPKKGNAKECSNYCTKKQCSKFSKPGFNSM